MSLSETLNKILDVKTGRGYISGDYNQHKREIKIKYEGGQEYEFKLSKYEDGDNEIVLYENESQGYDMPALTIRFDSVLETRDFYRKIYNEFNRDPLYLATITNVASKHKKKNKKRKSKKRKSKKRKSKKR